LRCQSCNVLGPSKSIHKEMGCQLAIGNLCTLERFKPDNILLPVLTNTNTYKKHGMARVISAVDKEGKQHDEPCFASDMRELDIGVEIKIPDDENGGFTLTPALAVAPNPPSLNP
jgi:hypothetical protein